MIEDKEKRMFMVNHVSYHGDVLEVP